MNDNDKVCECCGAKIVEYKHGLSKGIVRCLNKIARFGASREHGDKPVNLNDLGLNYNEQSNFQKLRYWELVEKADPESIKGGEWYITKKGISFISGEISLPQFAWSYRAKVVRYEGAYITVEDVDMGYKYRPHYAQEAVPHLTNELLF